MSARKLLWGMVTVLLVAAALRLVAFGEVPPGLYHDEAYHGLDVVDVLRGHFSCYFPANNGREPLFIYMIAVAVGLLGRSPFALRLVSFFAGLLTVAATGAMGRTLFSRRAGLLSAAVLAVTLWHVHLSRVGFRAVLLPLFIALVAWQATVGIRKAMRQEGQGGECGWHPDVFHPRPLRSTTSGRRLPDSYPHWLAAGILYGLSLYTYTAARFTPIALAAFGVYALMKQPALRDRRSAIGGRLWRGLGLAALAALVTLAPLAIYTLSHPDVVLGRPGQVSVLSPAIHGGDVWGTLGTHALRTLGMFFVRGDRIWRHNVPWRPVFDPLLGMTFLLGLVVALRRVRRDPAAGFVLIWTAVMVLPTLLAEDAPHFLRAVGVLPVVALLPALGLDWLANWLPDVVDRSGRCHPPSPTLSHSHAPTLFVSVWLRPALIALPLLFALGSTTWAYFGDYANDPMTGYWFECGAVALAGRINGFLGAGWDGERMVRPDAAYPKADAAYPKGTPSLRGTDDRRVYLDAGLWEEWPQVRFLVAAPEAVTVGLEDAFLDAPSTDAASADAASAVFAWPYGDWQRAWTLLPAPAEITVEEGPFSQGDRDPEPFTTYVAFFARMSAIRGLPDSGAPAMARFSGGVELLDVAVTADIKHPPADVYAPPPLRGGQGGGIRVRIRWRATEPLAEDYTVFLHYLRDGERVAQADSRPAGGYYPTTVWRPGDVVNDDHYVDTEDIGAPLPGHDVLLFGLWQAESGEVLYLLDGAGNPAGDWIEVPVDGY